MSFDSKGYELSFVTRDNSRELSCIKFTNIYTFYSPVTKLRYIVRAEYHDEDVFAIKFYVKNHAESAHKYNLVTNLGDTRNIIITCAKVIKILLNDFPLASFAFMGSRTYQNIPHKYQEPHQNNQRFRIYSQFIQSTFGIRTFTHFQYREIGGYLLINNKNEAIQEKERSIVKMIFKNYRTEDVF